MTVIAVTGGGSGGHITPVLAVAHELKKINPTVRIIYIGQTGDSLDDVPRADHNVDQVFTVRAGKFRRYHGEGWRQLLDIATGAKNIRDAWFVLLGIVQSYRLLKQTRPSIIFTRGSFVSVPVALAAVRLKIPYVTHDSDAIPSLANRIIARWAAIHTVALPKDVYPYPADKTVTVGVPISSKYRIETAEELRDIRHRLGFTPNQKIIFMTGGGLGAQRLNNSLVAIADELLGRYPDLAIVQLTGRAHAEEISNKYNDLLTEEKRLRVRVEGFVSNLYDYSAIADIVVTRAGGTSIAEFAVQAKACIIVPNPILTGGHQTKNAQVLAERQAAILITETELARDGRSLLPPITKLLDHPAETRQLGQRLHSIAQPDSAHKLGVLLLEQVSKQKEPNQALKSTQN
jgi:UDP-N-acetylglucosamine--N-acetylmuramyl-(pentapeptide) pyrophosphoryl-undecaprenol N-acetylglucosamine transferase